METNYEKQATDFLEKTGCKMTITYKENRKYFPEDKETRDVYNIEIKRGQRSWGFEFGNSLVDSEFVALHGKTKYRIPQNMRTKSNSEIELYVKWNLQSDFGTVKTDRILRPVEPSEYSVLACIIKDDPGSFEDFCHEFGYDEDSKTAERTYNAIVKEWQNVCIIWADDEIKELRDIY